MLNIDGVSCFSKESDCPYKLECLTAILNITSDLVVNGDHEGNISYLNRAAQQAINVEGGYDIFKDVYRQMKNEAFPKAMEQGYWHGEIKYIKDGAEGYLTPTLITQQVGPRQLQCFSAVIRDVTTKKWLNKQEILASNVLQNIIEGVVVTDENNTIISVNQAFTKVTGYRAEEVIGKNPNILSSGKHDANFYQNMWREIMINGFWKGEIWNRHKSGKIYLQHLKIKAIRDVQGKITNFVSLIEDITERKKLEEKIQFQAYHDSLTKLPNRYFFNERLEQELKRESAHGSVLLLDIDRFKRINETLGYQAGDELLRAVADRLLRKIGKKGTIARMEGNRFIMLFPSFSDIEARIIAEKMLDIFRYPFFIQNQEFMISGCIGMGVYPADGTDINTLYKNVDAALLKAKEYGSNNYAFYNEVTEIRSPELLTLENSLHWALREDQFELHYQPQLDIPSGRIIGYEVLVRWRHPERGLIPPIQFIPIAEDTGMIIQLDELVLRKTCQQILEWSRQGIQSLRASVNLSMKNFKTHDIVRRLQQYIEDTGIDPKLLVIELTESALMNNPDVTFQVLESIKQLGVEVALDDFGTGYSSLSYLKRLPIDYLKIDRSFIHDINQDHKSAELVKTIIQLAKSLELVVVSEGIETDEQLNLLRSYGCTEAQGYFIGKPVPKEQFEVMFIQQYS